MKSKLQNWQRLSLIERIRWLRLLLPPLLAVWVITYQLGFAQTLQTMYGHVVHYGVEIAFYSLAGPAVTWVTLTWVERKLQEKEALERQVQAAQQEKTAVLEEERARIARDLHDGVAQTLYFLALKADALRGQLVANDDVVADLREMGETTRKVIRDVRRTIFALRPLDWSRGEFVSSLKGFIAGFAEQVGWQTAVHIDTPLEIPPALEPTVFRLVQESLNNVAKHAQAKQVWIDITAKEDNRWLHLSIRDDGAGFGPQQANNHGYGLEQMKKRIETSDGTFQIQSQPGVGTAVIAQLPLLPKENRHE